MTSALKISLKRSLPTALFCCCVQAAAQTGAEDFLAAVADELRQENIEVLPNLNDREASRRLTTPRLGGFPDLPPGSYPNSAEIDSWEAAYEAGEVGSLILISSSTTDPASSGAAELDDSVEDYIEPWLGDFERDRVFVSFAVEDVDTALLISRIARQQGYETVPHWNGAASEAGEFYATAQYRLAIDSRAARRLRTDVTELELLGERLREDSASVFRDPVNRDDRSLARNEPRMFRKITLGDEFTQPTIEEIIVPGGIALGESAELDFTPTELTFDGQNLMLHGLDSETNGSEIRRRLPGDDLRELKALFDLTRRSISTRSDAMVDIDADRRVKITSALRDTDAGYTMLVADTQPFEFLDYIPVTKSVIMDTRVSWSGSVIEDSLPQQFETNFEVRFLSADRMRIAQTRLALEYGYDSATGVVNYKGNWGRDGSRLRERTNVSGLGEELSELARYAGWIALFRRLEEDAVPFLKGRYQFMKIDKAGRVTPRRFR